MAIEPWQAPPFRFIFALQLKEFGVTQSVQTRLERIHPGDTPWQVFHDPHGRPTTPVRLLRSDDPYLLEADFPPGFYAGLHWHPFDTIYLFTAGEMRVGAEGAYRPGDIRWVRAGHVYGPEEAGPDGVAFYLLSLGGEVGLNWADLYEAPADLTERLSELPQLWGRATVSASPPQAAPGVRREQLGGSGPAMDRLLLEPSGRLTLPRTLSARLLWVRSGAVLADAVQLAAADLCWLSASNDAVLAAGPEGADVIVIELATLPQAA
jgi:redox-sensitive bicupin YhaK (pirin superfamily)